MKFEHTNVIGFEAAFRGMRNPMNSWAKSDSINTLINGECFFQIGANDLELAQKLIKSGPEHRKFMRQIFVSVDITAPLFWWKEMDTYKVGTVANSTSTMHKLASTPITLDCFENDGNVEELDFDPVADCSFKDNFIPYLENLRLKYIETQGKKYWKKLIICLPESWLQKRTISMSYENVYSIVRQRKDHKLNEWNGKEDDTKPNFISWAKELPYSDELIFWGLIN